MYILNIDERLLIFKSFLMMGQIYQERFRKPSDDSTSVFIIMHFKDRSIYGHKKD